LRGGTRVATTPMLKWPTPREGGKTKEMVEEVEGGDEGKAEKIEEAARKTRQHAAHHEPTYHPCCRPKRIRRYLKRRRTSYRRIAEC
jgi:hypothetical protein